MCSWRCALQLAGGWGRPALLGAADRKADRGWEPLDSPTPAQSLGTLNVRQKDYMDSITIWSMERLRGFFPGSFLSAPCTGDLC